MRTRTFLILLIALSITPAATASWIGKGALEPDTKRDTTDGWNHFNPDQVAGGARKVYFNAFGGQEVGYVPSVGTGVNPNVGAVGQEHQTYPYRARAMLGAWKDCNKDGYVGYGEQGLFEYRVELLNVPTAAGPAPGTTVCGAESIPATIPRTGWVPPHNDGTWVREFVPIGWDLNPVGGKDNNPYQIVDSGARVWRDWGLPESAIQSLCYTLAHPRGSYHSVGGMVGLLDCWLQGKIENTVGPVGGSTWTQAKNVQNPWGDENGASMVTMFDCSQPPLVSVPLVVDTPVVNTDQGTFSVYPPQTPTMNTNGNPASTMNETENAIEDCDRSNSPNPSTTGSAPYYLEADVTNQNLTKFVNDDVLAYNEGFRNNAVNPISNPQQLGRATPGDLGTDVQATERTWGGRTLTGVSRNPYVNRDNAGPMPVTYITYYAFVSPGAVSAFGLTLPKGALNGVYGAEPCSAGIGAGQPARNQWECDPAKWWPATTEADTMPQSQISGTLTDIGTKVGDPFNLRDVDCFDESVTVLRQQGVGYGLATGTRCIPP